MTKKQCKKNNQNQTVWKILDECLTQDKNKWKDVFNGDIKSVKELKLLSVEDAIISKTLDTSIPNGKIVITSNKRPDKQGDYFKVSPIQGIIKFSSDIITQPEQKIYLRKFQQTIKNFSKLLGAETTLTKTHIIYKKGNKKKIRKYTQYF